MGEKGRETNDGGRPTVRIPKYRHDGDVIAWSEVDAEWWDHVQHARDVHERVVARYLHDPGVELIEMGRGEETIGGYTTETISITVTDEASAEALDLPEELDGVPIVVEIGTVSDTGQPPR